MSSTKPTTDFLSIQLLEELDINDHPSVRLHCKPSTSPTNQTVTTHKSKHFTEIRLEGISIDTIHLDDFLASQTKNLKKLSLINTHMRFLSSRDEIGEPCAVLAKIVYLLQHSLEAKSLEVKELGCDYEDNISPSVVTYNGKWEGEKEVRDGFAEMVAKIKERGNRGQMEAQESVKPQSSFVEMERWEDEYGFADDGEESDDDVYEHSEDEEWAM
ncbi:unnamed protein product [Aureobasidium mustum]|uniref:Uncharacterized protein n=1 Tax=Aureobasidium mustum TaxID=2773714 RepID=A0A9N8JYD8_9PEZI|nr:unnamed protein product [Aureobasidium mustum]